MCRAAPRLTDELVRAIGRLDDGSMPIADVWRLAGDAAASLGVPQPSYEQVRLWVHELRGVRQAGPTFGSTALVAAEVALRLKPPEALIEHIAEEWTQPGRGRSSTT